MKFSLTTIVCYLNRIRMESLSPLQARNPTYLLTKTSIIHYLCTHTVTHFAMDDYQEHIRPELAIWQKQMLRRPTIFNRLSKSVQVKMNSLIPEKVHQAITVTLKQMIRGVLFGANYTTPRPQPGRPLQEREAAIRQRIRYYKTTAAVEGGITGAGGILLGFADFPVLIGIKLKLLFDIASIYGFDVKDYKERVYILHIFELAFSSHEHRRNVYLKMVDWEKKSRDLPDDIHQFDWRNFQQEYRDYIDLAKMAQLVPFIGAPVGFVVNSRLVDKLGKTAMNAYRMRLSLLLFAGFCASVFPW